MSSEPKAFDELMALFARYGLEPFLESTRTLVVLLDADGILIGWNPVFRGFREHMPRAITVYDYLPESEKEAFETALERLSQHTKPMHVSLDLRGPDGRCSYDTTLVPLPEERFLLVAEPADMNGDGNQAGKFADDLERVKAELHEARLALDVKQKELKAVVAQADEVSHTDSLTLLPNRKLIVAELQRQVTYAERYGTSLAISMVDLDHFKEVNDTYGHTAGDQVLRFIGSEMRDHIRQPDQIGRYAGDEFLMILPHTTVAAAAEQAARLCQQVRSTPIIAGGHVIHMTLSVGIAQYRNREEDWRLLLERADQALYQSKHNGGDQWAVLEAWSPK